MLCQRAENEFVGARCGIMDQFVSCHGQADHALLLDCRSLDMRMLPVPPAVALIICNTMVKHELGASEYNARRADCEEAVRLLAKVLPGIRALRDVTAAQLEEHQGVLPETLYKRARHVITENQRVLQTAEAFEQGQMEKIGRLMANSHRSLREDYEVSCPELNAMVEIAARQRGVLGARMTGGGFGGCTINLVDAVRSGIPAESFRGVYQHDRAAARHLCLQGVGGSRGDPRESRDGRKSTAAKSCAREFVSDGKMICSGCWGRRTGDSIHCCANGCWFLRTGRSARGWAE